MPSDAEPDESLGYWIALNRVSGIGPSRLAALLDLTGSVEAAWRAPIQTLRAARFDRATIEALLDARRTLDPAREVERLRKAGVTALAWGHPDYPSSLRTIDRSPPVIFVRGALLPEDELAVAIVGTRHASAYGREVAHSLATELGRSGVTVVSGLALGVDAVAHRAALDAGGRTLAVLGSGVDEIWPSQNRTLGGEIMRSGALISDYPLGTRPEARNFPPRNRIISALSRAVVVVEAGSRSGALITAQYAAGQGRDVWAVPGNILNAGSAGCNALIRDGAAPLLSVDELLESLQVERVRLQQSVRAEVKTSPQEAQLLATLTADGRHMDDIVREAAMPSAAVVSLLSLMEMKGLVRQTAPMCFART
jgi:DNA processing protein